MPGNVCFTPQEIGETITIVPPDPAVQSDWTVTVPPNEIWLINVIKQHIVFTAGGFTHDCLILFTDGGGNRYDIVGNSATVRIGNATSIVIHSINNGNYNRVLTGCYSFPLPVFYLPAGWTVGSAWQNLTAADQINEIRLSVQRWRAD